MGNKKLIKYEDLWVGMEVTDGDNNIGIIKNCDDIHNVNVDFNEGCGGLYCLVEGCTQKEEINGEIVEIPHYNPLYYLS